ncbi:MAG: carboxylesterase family protein [Candidatus Heimdallarchaeota archaeon]
MERTKIVDTKAGKIQGFKDVTIFGESAGGWSVSTLLAKSEAKGLFHRVIAQS